MTADAFSLQLRQGHVPTPTEIETYMRIPLVYDLREGLTDDDLPWLMALCRNPAVRNDFISTLVGWMQRAETRAPEVWKWVLQEWATPASFEWKQGLLWLLAENSSWGEEERRSAASWLLANLGPFLTICARWWGTPEERLARVRSSLDHRGRPPEKAFIYLCVCMGSSDIEGSRSLFQEFMNDSSRDAVSREVARRLLNLLLVLSNADRL